MTPRRSLAALGALLVAGGTLLSGSCTDNNLAAPEPLAAAIYLSSAADTLVAGDSVVLQAIVKDSRGRTLDTPISWRSSDAGVATVSAAGVIHGLDGGTADIEASAGEFKATAQIHVLERVVVVTFDAPAITLSVGDTSSLHLVLRDHQGGEVARPATLSVLDPSIVLIQNDQQGWRLYGRAVGMTEVIASIDGLADTVTVTVRQAVAFLTIDSARTTLELRDTVRLTARTFDQNYDRIQRRIDWSSTATNVATVDTGGLVTASGAGTATIIATSGRVSDSLALTVVPAIGGLTITNNPSELFLEPGDTLHLQVSTSLPALPAATSAAQGPNDNAPSLVGFRSSNSGVATVSASGDVVAVGRGKTTITAWRGTFTDSVDVVVQWPVKSVGVSPDAISVGPSTQVTMTAVARDSAANVLAGQVFTWKSGDPSVAEVNGAGVAITHAEGQATITASVRGVSGTATITVERPVTLTFHLDPATDSLVVGDSVQLTVILSNGRSLPANNVTWTSSDPAVTVSASGMARAVGEGTATVKGTAGSVSSSATIRVFAEPAAVEVRPTQPRFRIGDVITLKGVTKNASGAEVDGTVTWTTSNASIVSVDQSGKITGVSEGVATITATSGTTSGETQVTVSGRRPAEGTSFGNNLSWPVVFAEGVGLTGNPVTVSGAPDFANTGLRPATTENVLVTGLPFFFEANRSDCALAGQPYFCQQSINTWQAEWRDGSALGVRHASAKWGDNLTHTTATTSSPLRVEVSLGDLGIGMLRGYDMVSISGEKNTEVMGTRGTTSDYAPTIYSRVPRLIVQKLADRGGAIVATAFDQQLLAAADGPGNFSTEVNGAGKLVYGYVMDLSRYTLPAGVTQGGWWRLTFQLDESAGGATRNVVIDTVANLVVGEELTYTPVRGANGLSTSLDIFLSDGTGRAPTRSIRIEPRILTLAPNETGQLTASFQDVLGRMVTDDRPVTWTSRDPAIATVSGTGLVRGIVKGMIYVLGESDGKLDSTKVIVDAGAPVNPGETGAGNNLSVPVIFTEGRGLTGLPVTVNGQRSYATTGLRPASTEGITVSALPFFYSGNVPSSGLFLQNSGNTWQAEWADGLTAGMRNATVTWGDNITSHAWTTTSHIRVEVSLGDAAGATLTGYNMVHVSGSGSTSVEATDGTTGRFVPNLFSVTPRLLIQKLSGENGTVVQTFVDQRITDALGSAEETGVFTVEVNGVGKVVYGYSLVPSSLPLPEGATREGWWRVSFVLDDAADIGGQRVSRNVALQSVTNVGETGGEGGEGGSGSGGVFFQPKVSADGKVSWIDIPITAGQGGGGGGGDTGPGNNLSWPVVFAEGRGVSGLDVTQDAGLRPLSTEGITVGARPFFYSGNVADCTLGTTTFYCQGTANVWQAEWLNGSSGPVREADVKWGDNLTHHTFDTHAPIRIEVTLGDLAAGQLRGFNMTHISGSGSTEVQGTDGTTGLFVPTLYTEAGRLIIEKLDDTDTTRAPIVTIVDRGVWQRADGPGNFAAEVNVSGKVVFGYNFKVQDLDAGLFGGAHKFGWWRLTFALGGTGAPAPNAHLQRLAAVSEEEGGESLKYMPAISSDGQRSSLTIYIEKGGGGGGGGHTP